MAQAQKCSVCGKEGRLQNCSRCKTGSYCGGDCQKADWPTHKTNCKAENYLLHISLCPDEIDDPPVRRTLSCPTAATFAELQEALQVAFGWASTHTFDFKIRDPNAEPEPEKSMEEVMRMLMSNNGQGPSSSTGPRQNLLRIINQSGGSIDEIHNSHRVHLQTPEIGASRIKLSKVFENKEYKHSPIEYEYDFGDGWNHAIVLVGRAPASDVFTCTDGEGHGVAEDVGAARGWQDLKNAYRSQNPTNEQKESMHWFEKEASNNDPRGLYGGRDRVWDKTGINFMLARLG